MFTEAFDTVKGWFGGKKKQVFANLDNIIPGYTLMSPRTKCDSAISALIKEISKSQLKTLSVFSLADAKRTGKATVVALRTAFIKLAPKID